VESTSNFNLEQTNSKIVATSTRFQIITVVLLNIQVFGNVTPHRLLHTYRCFKISQRLHFQD